ncbi:MAG: hypothetical protein BWX55_00266 [Deltaproteobacteria bacterium ADurb.Bin022]|nr:MAG: hypothetical protein BWX55_00266 [Deltaproteobacteria bacterium ADurb.Bin022]
MYLSYWAKIVMREKTADNMKKRNFSLTCQKTGFSFFEANRFSGQ